MSTHISDWYIAVVETAKNVFSTICLKAIDIDEMLSSLFNYDTTNNLE